MPNRSKSLSPVVTAEGRESPIVWRLSLPHLISAALTVCVLLLAALQIRAWNGAVNADGISYLELASQYARGDWSSVANGYWSPLYPILLGGGLRLAHATTLIASSWTLTPELQVTLAVNLCIAVFATMSFARLLLALDSSEQARVPTSIRGARFLASGALWVWWVVRLAGVTTATPDLLLSAWLVLATRELVNTSAQSPTKGGAVRLAMMLALGYWTKAVFFPLVVVGLLAHLLLIAGPLRRRHLPWLLWPSLALCAPLVAVQSFSHGHLTFGETGRLNYRWYVNDAKRAEPIVESELASRSRGADRAAVVRINSAPGVVLYSGGPASSFPYWYDPSRFEPVRPTSFSLAAQWRVLRANGRWFRVVAGVFGLLCVAVAALAAHRQRHSITRAVVAIPTVTCLALYALTHPEGRLAGSAIVSALVIAMYPGGSSNGREIRRSSVLLECGVLTLVVVVVGLRVSSRVSLSKHDQLVGPQPQELARVGAGEGTAIAVLGSPYGHYWAHRGGVRIAVASEADGDRPEPNEETLSRIAEEACARGTPLSAILWRGAPLSPQPWSVSLQGGWYAWRAPAVCDRANHDSPSSAQRKGDEHGT